MDKKNTKIHSKGPCHVFTQPVKFFYHKELCRFAEAPLITPITQVSCEETTVTFFEKKCQITMWIGINLP